MVFSFPCCPELRIKRQNSSDSISSLNSITSHSSIGSGKDADAKKKKKKSWVGQERSEAKEIKFTSTVYEYEILQCFVRIGNRMTTMAIPGFLSIAVAIPAWRKYFWQNFSLHYFTLQNIKLLATGGIHPLLNYGLWNIHQSYLIMMAYQIKGCPFHYGFLLKTNTCT